MKKSRKGRRVAYIRESGKVRALWGEKGAEG